MDERARELSRKAGDGDLEAARLLVRHLERLGEADQLQVAEFRTPAAEATSSGAFVLRRVRGGRSPEWATYRRTDEDRTFSDGRYFRSLSDAAADFAQRVAGWAAEERAREREWRPRASTARRRT